MIHTNFDQYESDYQVVDDNYPSVASYNPNAFYRMNQYDMRYQGYQRNYDYPYYYSPQLAAGYGSPNFFKGKTQNDQIVTPNSQSNAAKTSNNQGSQCSGSCGACVWGFLCKKAASKLTSLGGSAPKLV